MKGRFLCAMGAQVTVAGVVLALASAPAHAEIGGERRPVSLFSPGATFEVGIDGSLRFGGEVAAAQYSGRWGFGAAAGFVPGRLYLEGQPALVLGGRSHNVVLGLNPGFVIDVTGKEPRYGGQATLWGNYARAAARPWALPLFPFARVQAVLGMGFAVTGGLMLKLPVPVS
ncbi:MAG: hypothetical protein JXP73_16785 [Deltaproteobacteria bacterium]|nr:hypothetical protein [Deltaproteobacteria bacterium]